MGTNILALNTGPQTAELLKDMITADRDFGFFEATASEKDLGGPFPREPDLLCDLP